MSVPAPVRPSGIKPPSSRLVKPSISSKTSSNGSAGDAASITSSEDLSAKKKVSIDRNTLLDGDERDQLTDLPSLPGSRRTSEQARKLSDGSSNALDAAAYEMARRLSEAGVRRMSDANIVLTTDTDSFIIGQRVFVNGMKPGVIQFIGETKFAPGDWAGIVLDDFTGKNDGSVGGHRYFQCQPKKGVFSRLARLTRQPLSAEQLAIISAQQSSSENGDESSAATSPIPPISNIPTPAAASSPLAPPAAPSSMVSVQSIGDLRLGDRVIVTSTQGSKMGILRYLGQTEFAVGQWAGVELDEALGKNDGAVAGTRYFDCQPMHGLFAPIHKVSRSPANHMRRTSGSLMNSSMTSSVSNRPGMTRQGTRDSFCGASDRASIASVASSRASTAVSRKPSRPSVGGSTHANLQEMLREKEQHIEQLMKEREMERSEVTRAATQADEAENRLAILQQQFNDQHAVFQAKIQLLERQLADNEAARSSMAAQIDDLQFRIEEETILRSDLEAQHANGSDEKDKEWAKMSEQLEKEAQRCFEAEELAASYKDELDTMRQGQQPDDAKHERLKQLEDALKSRDVEITELKDSVAGLSKALESEQHKCCTVEEQFRVAENELESTRSSLSHAKDAGLNEAKEWQSKLENAERQLVETAEQLAKSNDDKLRLEALLTEAKNALIRLRDAGQSESSQLVVKLQEAEHRDLESRQQIGELMLVKERLEHHLSQTNDALDKAKETNVELNDVKEKLRQLEHQTEESKAQLLILHNEKANLQAQLTEAQSNLAKTKHTGDSELNDVKVKFDELEQLFTQSKQELDELKQEKRSLEAKLAASEVALAKSKQDGQTQSSDMLSKMEHFDRQVSSLKSEVTTLQNQKAELESKLDDALSTLSQIKESSVFELNEVTIKLQDLQAENDESRKLLFRVEEEKSKIEGELFEARETMSQLEEANQNKNVKMNQLTEELKAKSQDVQRLTAENNEQLAKLDAEKVKLEAEIQAARHAIRRNEEVTRVETEQTQKELEEFKSKLKTSEKRGAELSELLLKLGEDKAKAEEELRKQIDREHEEWKAKYEEVECQKASSDQRVARLNEEKARLESEVLKLSSSSSDVSQDLTRLHGELMAARQALAESQSSGAQTEQARAALEQQLTALRQELKDRVDRINELSAERSDLEDRLGSAKKSFSELEKQLQNEQDDRQKLKFQLQSDIQSRDEQIAVLSTAQTELEGQLKAFNHKLTEENARYDEEKSGLLEQLELLQLELSKKDKESKELTSYRAAIEDELESVRKTLANVESQFKQNSEESERTVGALKSDLEAHHKEMAELKAMNGELEVKLNEVNTTLATNQSLFEKEKAEIVRQKANLRSEIIERDNRIADLQSAADEYESELNITKQENARNAELLKALESNQEQSMGSVTDLQKAIAVLELEKSNLLLEKEQLEAVLAKRETQLSTLNSDKEETGRKLQERDDRLAQLMEEVGKLQSKFASHVAELEQKLEENKKAEETERELQVALQEARGRADELQSALEESRRSQEELFEAQEHLATLSVAHEELNERFNKEKEESKKRIDELVAEKEAVYGRESKLNAELVTLKKQIDEQCSRLQSQLQETKREAETVHQLINNLEAAQKRVKDLESTIETTNQDVLAKLDEASRRIKGLEEQLQIKTVELKEEMDDRDKAEDRCLKLAEHLRVKDGEVESLRQEVKVLKKSSTDVSHLMSAFTTVDKEKKQLEAKVVELQVATAAASRGAEAKETDSRIRQLKEDNETLQREIYFLNSVIVDMQKKVDDLKLKLEVSQATLLGQNISDDHGVNGMKPKTVAPRLFCDICDMFDLHDTEDCPKQASYDIESPPALLKHDSSSYTQHSHYGGARGASRPYCENCEVFGHATQDCDETTY